MVDLQKAFIMKYCPKTWKRFKKELTSEYIYGEGKNKVVYHGIVTAKQIKSMIIECDKMKFYPPYLLFCRTGKDEKHRCVFGAPWPIKMLSALQSAFKYLGYKAKDGIKEVICDGQYFYAPDKTLPASGELPLCGQEEWDTMFDYFISLIKKLTDANYNLTTPGMDIVGSDVSGWDKRMRYCHVSWMLKYKPLRWLFSYTYNTCRFSEVWVGPKRISLIFWKSGHELT